MAHRGGHTGMRQRKHWHAFFGSATAVSADSTVLLDTFTAAGGEPFTILRMIGEVGISFASQTLVANDAASITVGIGVVSADAATLGASALPDPLSEPEYSWLWWYSTVIRNMTVTTEALFPQGGGYSRKEINSKAMRRVGPRESLVAVAQYSDVLGTPSITIDLAGTRILIGT